MCLKLNLLWYVVENSSCRKTLSYFSKLLLKYS